MVDEGGVIPLDIKSRRIQLGLTLQEVADAVGVSNATISRWETGSIKNMRRDKIFALANILKADPLEFMSAGSDAVLSTKSRLIPLIGTVTAGNPIDRIEIHEGVIEVPLSYEGDYFALRIKGDSMEPKISNGDIVIVRKQEDADDGDVVIAAVNGDEATCKKLRKFGGSVMLQPTNSAYTPIIWDGVHGAPVTIIGKVVELRSRF